jgi:hypothetical protein
MDHQRGLVLLGVVGLAACAGNRGQPAQVSVSNDSRSAVVVFEPSGEGECVARFLSPEVHAAHGTAPRPFNFVLVSSCPKLAPGTPVEVTIKDWQLTTPDGRQVKDAHPFDSSCKLQATLPSHGVVVLPCRLATDRQEGRYRYNVELKVGGRVRTWDPEIIINDD